MSFIDMMKPMYARYTKDFLKELMEIWPDPKTGQIGMSPSSLAVQCGFKSRQSVYSYLQGTEPSSEARLALGNFFRIVRFADDENIDNSKVLNDVRSFLESYVYQKAS